jgi:excisionase family DNA binding protein
MAMDPLNTDPNRPVDPRRFGLLKAAYGVKDTIELLSVGRTTLYAAVKRGELRPIKCGRKTLFLAADLAGFLAKLMHLSHSEQSISKSVRQERGSRS